MRLLHRFSNNSTPLKNIFLTCLQNMRNCSFQLFVVTKIIITPSIFFLLSKHLIIIEGDIRTLKRFINLFNTTDMNYGCVTLAVCTIALSGSKCTSLVSFSRLFPQIFCCNLCRSAVQYIALIVVLCFLKFLSKMSLQS